MMKNLLTLLLGGLTTLAMATGPDKDSTVAPHPSDSLLLVTFEDDPFAARLDSLMTISLFDFGAPDSNLFVLDSLPVINSSSIPDSIFEYRLALLDAQTPFDLTYNPIVKRYIELYTDRRRDQVSRMLGLAEYYFPMFEQTLDKYDLPLELKYLAIVESALNPQARSHVGAQGLWQFMYATARLNGLNISSYVDERCDPIKSTEAACQFLSKLYEIFGDWNLALAAYNSGPGNVSKAIRRSGGKRNYWEIRPYLPRETAGYVPAFIAVNYTMAYAQDHNLYPTPPLYNYVQVDTIKVKGRITFDQISKFVDIDSEELKWLNPSYRYGIIPVVKDQEHFLVLPIEQAGQFISNEDTIYRIAQVELEEKKQEMPQYVEQDTRIKHKVRSGQTLGGIAEKYGVSISDIRRWNGLRGNMIRSGQYLTIYPRKVPQQDNSKTASSKPVVQKDGDKEYYTVQQGDTLYNIAQRYPGISADNIMQWNNIKRASSLRPGTKLVIYPGS